MNQKDSCNYPKMETIWLAMNQKDADRMTNSVDPDQTTPRGAAS